MVNHNSPYISIILLICMFLPSKVTSKIVKKVHFNEVFFLLTIPKQDQEYLSAPSLDCLCPAGPTPSSCKTDYQTRTGISLCSRPRLSLPSKGLFLIRWQCADTGPFCKSRLPVKSFSLVLLGPYKKMILVKIDFLV